MGTRKKGHQGGARERWRKFVEEIKQERRERAKEWENGQGKPCITWSHQEYDWLGSKTAAGSEDKKKVQKKK